MVSLIDVRGLSKASDISVPYWWGVIFTGKARRARVVVIGTLAPLPALSGNQHHNIIMMVGSNIYAHVHLLNI
jgi:hypothetical protein